jgi:hypothetical protein
MPAVRPIFSVIHAAAPEGTGTVCFLLYMPANKVMMDFSF